MLQLSFYTTPKVKFKEKNQLWEISKGTKNRGSGNYISERKIEVEIQFENYIKTKKKKIYYNSPILCILRTVF